MNNIIVFCETDNGKLCDVSLELLTKARSLAQTLKCDLEALLIGYNVENLKDELYLYGVKKIHLADDIKLEFFRTLPYASIAISLFRHEQPQIALLAQLALDVTLPQEFQVPFTADLQQTVLHLRLVTTRMPKETNGRISFTRSVLHLEETSLQPL